MRKNLAYKTFGRDLCLVGYTISSGYSAVRSHASLTILHLLNGLTFLDSVRQNKFREVKYFIRQMPHYADWF
ncbi:unnamed protein product [Brugia timori]|uniref:Ovule protein n=1 Tax=Brugia timori TaxID=42155 RepID=A0A0R3Q7X2_9BILA|nr:unnamed protein product [Brugia timori]